jgi:hypothetical protein
MKPFKIALVLLCALAVTGLSSCTGPAETVSSATVTPSLTAAVPTPFPFTSPVFDSPVRVPPSAGAVNNHATSPLPRPVSTPTALATPSEQSSTPVYTFDIVNTFPHDPGAFTQGLVFQDGVLYEGTGLRGQ